MNEIEIIIKSLELKMNRDIQKILRNKAKSAIKKEFSRTIDLLISEIEGINSIKKPK